jgi:hypothetical protein
MGQPIHLIQGAVYEGRIEAFAPSVLGKSMIAGKVKSGLEGVGFTDVTAWPDADNLPADWPPEAKADLSGSGHTQTWVLATWSKATGDYPSSGDDWQVIDDWPVSVPQGVDTTCVVEGYSCDPNAPAGATTCCQGLQCANDAANAFGGGTRCMQAAALVNPPKQGTSALEYVLGAVAVVAAVWAGWTYGAPALGLRAKRNPAEAGWRKVAADRKAGAAFFDGLRTEQKWDLGDELVLGTFDWGEWFDRKPSRAFMDGVDEARINWEIARS